MSEVRNIHIYSHSLYIFLKNVLSCEWFSVFVARQVWICFYPSCPWLVMILGNGKLYVLSPNSLLGKDRVGRYYMLQGLQYFGYQSNHGVLLHMSLFCRSSCYHSLLPVQGMQSWEKPSPCSSAILWY